jgi:hypothetical protein
MFVKLLFVICPRIRVGLPPQIEVISLLVVSLFLFASLTPFGANTLNKMAGNIMTLSLMNMYILTLRIMIHRLMTLK